MLLSAAHLSPEEARSFCAKVLLDSMGPSEPWSPGPLGEEVFALSALNSCFYSFWKCGTAPLGMWDLALGFC